MPREIKDKFETLKRETYKQIGIDVEDPFASISLVVDTYLKAVQE